MMATGAILVTLSLSSLSFLFCLLAILICSLDVADDVRWSRRVSMSVAL